MTVVTVAPTTSAARARAVRRALPALLAGLLAWALLFHAEIAAAVHVWTVSTAYNHGFIVLPLALWLAWDRRGAASGLLPVPTLLAALAALPLGLVWFAADRLGIMEGRQLAALALLETVLVAWMGWRLARVFAAPLAYLVFLVPFGAFLTPALQSFTARFIDVGLTLIGIPHVVTAYLIEIPQGRFVVAEACAGLRFLVAAIAFGALYALLMYRSPRRRLAFLAISCVVPVIANGIRALGIVVLGYILGSAEAAGADHLIYGWGFFSLVILLLTVGGLPFREDIGVPAAPAHRAAPPPKPIVAWAAVAAVALLAATAPTLAALLDRRAAAGPVPTLPGFTAAGTCRAIDPPGPVRHFDCAGSELTAAVRALPAGSGPAALAAALQTAVPRSAVEADVQGPLAVGGVTWRLAETLTPARLVATLAFIDGAPGRGGLAMRLRLARDGFGGGGGAVVLAASITPTVLTQAARQAFTEFLAGQATLLAAAARASAPRPPAP